MVDYQKETEIDIQGLLNDLSVHIQKVVKAGEFFPHAFLVSQTWFNAYGPNQNQESHNHVPSDLSGVYYITYDPAVHKATTFLNPDRMYFEGLRYGKRYYDESMRQYGCYKEELTLETLEGDVILFPSQLEHMVHKQPGIEVNRDGKLRIGFSFNIELISEKEANDVIPQQQSLGGPQADRQVPQDGDGSFLHPGGLINQENGPVTGSDMPRSRMQKIDLEAAYKMKTSSIMVNIRTRTGTGTMVPTSF